jgi:hypothetical protein
VGTEAIVGEGVGRKDAEGVGKLVKDVGAKVAIALQMAGLGSSKIDCNKRFARDKWVRFQFKERFFEYFHQSDLQIL